MITAYFDAYSGIAGDMTVGALLDAGADRETLLDGLRSLETGASFRVERTKRKGIAGTKFHVDIPEGDKKHRHLHHIVEMIEKSPIPSNAKAIATKIFTVLGEAEAQVHGIEIRKVHFHEVGAIDSICDIVGAAIGFDLLGIERIACSPINVGGGTVTADHGVMPVPTPATALMLKDKPVYSSGPQVELTTPTGAAIAAAMATAFGPMPAMSLHATGFGAGDKDFPQQANLLRVLIGEASRATEATAVSVIEANIDDASPQILGYTLERLMREGALDASIEPIYMKKNRPGSLLRVVAKPEDRERLAAVVFAETPTLGLRIVAAERRVLEREIRTVETQWGPVRVKIAQGHAAPEYDDCRQIAEEKGIPLRDVIAAALLHAR
ncbi:MAG: nickel pincer cofactor biosynthesis protein LarC [Bryobacteraceae bacterium]|nr:nickel pincer cofactor biosynthesis protein LarC [Bryobacteraceae bacterium]